MKTLFRLFVLALLVGGWALAAAAVHVVRVNGGPLGSLGTLEVIPKHHLGYGETFADLREWTPADRADHPLLTARLIELNRADLLPAEKPTTQPAVAEAPKPAPMPEFKGTPEYKAAPEPVPAAPAPKHQPNIFDD